MTRIADGLRGWAYERPRIAVLVPGQQCLLGWEIERAAATRGWSGAISPATTDVLVVVGDADTLGPVLRSAADLWWRHVGAPRVRVEIGPGTDIASGLDFALDALRDWSAQASEAATRAAEAQGNLAEVSTSGSGEEVVGPADHGGAHDGHEMAEDDGHDMPGHDNHEMAGHEHHVEDVAGLPMAGTGEDRDGLTLDVLTVRLGPFLHGWPTGLVIRTELSGDVISGAAVEWRAAPGEPVPQRAAVAQALGAVLDLAGWTAAARAVTAIRDAAVAGRAPTQADRRWLTRVARSRSLRWALSGIGPCEGSDAADRVIGWARLLLKLPADQNGSGTTVVRMDLPSSDVLVAAVTGTELARARLAVASLLVVDPVPDTIHDHVRGHQYEHDDEAHERAASDERPGGAR